jgi:uncharacterized MAPEG superfamily protein
MEALMENDAFLLYAVCSAIVALQLLALALWTGTIRILRKKWVNPEDARLNKGENVEVDHPDVARVKRAHTNLLENAVPFFVLGLLYVLTGANESGAQAYFFTFTGARLLHTVFYLRGIQPFRTLCFGVGVLAMIGMSVQVISAVT